MAGKGKPRLHSAYWRGAIAIVTFLVLWELGSLSKVWIKWDAFEWLRTLLVAFGFKPIYLPWIGAVPAPTEVLAVWLRVVADPGYWQSWYMLALLYLVFAAMISIFWAPLGGANLKTVSLKAGFRFQLIIVTDCGRASSARLVITILRGSGLPPAVIQIWKSILPLRNA